MKTFLPCIYLLVPRKYVSLICFLTLFLCNATIVSAQTVTTGKSYINVSRPNGGTFLPGDTIEVRATIAVTGGSNSSSSTRINFTRYNDTINLTKFTYITGSLQVLSNEGHIMWQYTDGINDDQAHIDLPSGKIRFNVGNIAGTANVVSQGTGTGNAGRLWGALVPTFFGGTTIWMLAYRVVINSTPSVVDIDSTITLSAGNFRYRIGSSSTDQLSGFSPYYIKIAPDYGLCSNAVGSNAIVGESGGTFGSGTTQNKAGGTSFVPAPYTFRNFASNAPNDNYYGVANTTSSDGTTNPNVAYSSGPGSSSRVFTVWDIIGDHTGAADPYAGNLPSTTGGYAVIINASYEINRAFEQTITNLCEETYYEFSAWFRNICRRCGCDSSGRGASQSGYVPSPGNDSSGVRPNLTFKIDNEDYYTSGNIAYTGLWVKKGFVFKTKPGQTSITLSIRNNAPGGGGNDWAIDDIGLTTCLPNMQYSPSIAPNVCQGNALTITDTVRSYFDNYTHYQWQLSTDGGTNWSDVATPGNATPYFNSSQNVWEYTTSYTTPILSASDSGHLYRVVVATSTTNLSDNDCSTTDATNVITLNVLDCGEALETKLISFSGKITDSKATLKWTTSTENNETVFFDIEKSFDGTNFTTVTTINGNSSAGQNYYIFTDPDNITKKVYYRIRIINADGRGSYSRILQLFTSAQSLGFTSVINPFNHSLFFDISSAKTGKAAAELIDQFGNPIRKKALDVRDGVTQFTFENTSSLSVGIYILKVQMGESVIYRKVLKQNY